LITSLHPASYPSSPGRNFLWQECTSGFHCYAQVVQQLRKWVEGDELGRSSWKTGEELKIRTA